MRKENQANTWHYAWLCVGIFAVALWLIWPVVASGVLDDFSYIRTAEVLARTGHLRYNGWATAMLGWPLYVAALAMRCFRFSFTVARMVTIAEALCVVFLLQRTYVLAGVRNAIATLGTLTVAFMPVFLFAATTFMSDMAGLLAVTVCFYACLRAALAASDRQSVRWLVCASLGNAFLGTSRQIAWLGVLVMVPATLWLLRDRRRVLRWGALTCAAGWIFVAASVYWFKHQPYTPSEPLVRGHLSVLETLRRLLLQVGLRVLLDAVLFSLPVLLAFAPKLQRHKRRALLSGVVLSAVALGVGLHLRAVHHLDRWSPPFLLYADAHPQAAENTFASIEMPPKGRPPLPLTGGLQLTFALLILLGLVCATGAIRGRHIGENTEGRWRRKAVLTLLLPFGAAYCALLMPRGLFIPLFDRYLLLLLPPVLTLPLLRLQALRLRPGWIGWGTLALVAGYGVATTHDFFATYRGCIAAVAEVRAKGVPRTAIDAGWEYDLYTEMMEGGYIPQPGTRMPDGRGLVMNASAPVTPCSMRAAWLAPHLHPVYALAYETGECPQAEGFSPISFHTWLAPRSRQVWIVQYRAR